MVESSLPIVTVTGATGYIGSYCCKLLLESGKYRVRGTVRSKTNEAKIAPIREGIGELFEMLELVEADLLDEASLIKAAEGSTYILHVASPFVVEEPKDENVLIKPAVDGTLAIMKAAQAAKVKRVVVTSSVAAIYGVAPVDVPDDDTYSEEHWTDITSEVGKAAYYKSKTLAEKAAWDFLKALPEEEKFELTTINPVFVVGPSVCGPGYSSMKVISDVVTGKLPGMPYITFSFVDVRDVAEAHVKALEAPEAAGRRIITSAESMWMSDMGKILHDEFAPQGYEFNTKVPAYCMIKFASFFSKEIAGVLPLWGK